MIDVHLSVGQYAVFRAELMHVLSIGVSRFLKESVTHMKIDDKKRYIGMHKTF